MELIVGKEPGIGTDVIAPCNDNTNCGAYCRTATCSIFCIVQH
ncbi:hypothetical protein [Anaeromonas gelatinilytica]|nr:hypothetical protein [Anaeromonas gelatinilytica]